MRVLGIETSCDETGTAVFDTADGLLADALHSQVNLHAVYGGVVPEIAARDHLRRLLPMVRSVLREAGIDRPDTIAYTAGPGLVGALMVGSGLANGLAAGWGCPVVPVHHMEGHLLALSLDDQPPAYPYLALLVSGGHTMLVDARALGDYRILGRTLDDAAGEAFDKTAKLLDLDYPGGPALAKLAESGDEKRYSLPRPMLGKPGADFSFSGLKTAVMLLIRETRENGDLESAKPDIAASFQRAVVDSLVGRTLQAANSVGAERIVVAGGVGANKALRATLDERFAGLVRYPQPELCTDNGAMIAVAGALRLAEAQRVDEIVATARWSLEALRPPTAA